MGKQAFKLALLGAAAIGLAAVGGCRREPPKPINVLLVSIDSLRADHLGCYGYGRETSPQIDRLAREGTIFLNHISTTSWTLPSHISLFTGQEISAHGVATDGFSLHPAVPPLAELIRDAGFRTAAFCTSPYMNAAFGFDRGFDLYYNTDSERGDYLDTVLPSEETKERSHLDITSPRIAELANSWLEENAEQPFFLFLHFWDPHYDYTPPPPYDRIFNPGYTGNIDARNYGNNDRVNPEMDPRDLEQIIALYDGEIAFTDHHLGTVIDKLKELGVYDQTLIVITGDHGEEFFEHDNKGHRISLYEEVIRVPLVVRRPGQAPGGNRVEAPVGIIDVAPTILDLLQITRPGSIQGTSLAPWLNGGEPDGERFLLSELSPVLYSLRGEGVKLLHNADAGATIVLDLESDPAETHSVEITSGPQFERLNREFQNRLRRNRELAEEIRGGEAGPKIHFQEREIERLRTLGYL